MRVLIVGPASSPIIKRLYKNLKSCGVDVILASHESDNSIDYINLGKANNFLDFLRFWKIRKIVRRQKPDLVHAHIVNHYGLMSIFCGKPILLALWGSEVMLDPNNGSKIRRTVLHMLNWLALKMSTCCHTSGFHVAVEAEKQCAGVIEKTEVFYWGFPLEKLPDKKYQEIKKRLEIEFNFELKNLIVSPRGLSEIYNPEGVGILISELLKKIPSLSRKIVVLKGFADENDEINFKKILNQDSVIYINRILTEAELYCLYVNSKYHISIPYSDSLGGGVVEPAELGSIPILSNIPSYIKYLNEYPGILVNDKLSNLMEICEVISRNYYDDKKILSYATDAVENSTTNRIIRIYDKILKNY
jgi:hypothetical protein